MPIFISRFSPERGLVGLLQSVNSGGRSKEQEATQKSPITRETRGANARRETEGTRRKSSETKDAANTAAIQRPNRGETTLQAGGANNQRTVDGRDGLTAVGNSGLIFTLNASRAEVAVQTVERSTTQISSGRTEEADHNGIPEPIRESNVEASESVERFDFRAIVVRVRAQSILRGGLETESPAGGIGSGFIAQRLQGFLANGAGVGLGEDDAPAAAEGENQAESILAGAAETEEGEIPQGTKRSETAKEGQEAAEDQGQAGFAPVALPPAEVQREAVRDASREIGQGLQRDAEIQTSINVEQSVKSADRSADKKQRLDSRDNQNQVRSLQAQRNTLQREVRMAEEKIRKLQSQTRTTTTSGSTNVFPLGSRLNFLVQ